MRARFERYHIGVKEAPPKFRIPARFIVKRYNNCSNVQECTQACVYGVHVVGKDGKIAEPINDLCRGCLVCVLRCPDLAISVEENPESQKMGDRYFSADRIRTIYFEAEAGRVPVSGTGYGGSFGGRGFDGIWFDFSEIVRPTRDGIHGREYISTSVDLGRRPSHLTFSEKGELLSSDLNIVEIPIPMILDAPLDSGFGNGVRLAEVKAAQRLGTFAVVDLKHLKNNLLPYISNIIPRITPDEIENAEDVIKQSRIIEVDLRDGRFEQRNCFERIKGIHPSVLVSFSLSHDDASVDRAYILTDEGADIVHLYVRDEAVEDDPETVTRAIQRIHSYLVKKDVRERVTLVSSGGIGEAAHVPKSVILGADAVGVGLAYQIALGCKVCYHERHSDDCQLAIRDEDVDWAAQRIVNLVGSWRDQLLEVLGGMGLREIRRQRGEMGRAMFYDDLESKIFGGCD